MAGVDERHRVGCRVEQTAASVTKRSSRPAGCIKVVELADGGGQVRLGQHAEARVGS